MVPSRAIVESNQVVDNGHYRLYKCVHVDHVGPKHFLLFLNYVTIALRKLFFSSVKWVY
jgi:hypothetical protein